MPSSLIPTNSDVYNLEFFFELSPDLMCVAGYDGYFKKVNPSFIKTLGFSESELFSKPISEFIHEKDREITKAKRKNLLNTTLLTQFENRYVHKNGSTIWLHWSSIALKEKGVVYAVAKDITAKKVLEIERNKLLQSFNETNKDLKDFNYSSSHDLRSPLSNLISLHSLLETTDKNNPEFTEYLDLLKVSTLHINEVITSYMDKWIKKEQLKLELHEVNFQEILEKTTRSIHQLLAKDQVQISTDFEKAPTVFFSKNYLQSIFLNLITNSIKYSKNDEKPVLEITSKKTPAGIQLIFKDNGIGIDLKIAGDRIFKLHQRFHNSEEVDSNGIGLYLVYSHITSLGGKVEIASEPDCGTIFTITFKDKSLLKN